ncbi:MAG: ATP-binding protein [Tetrasphaera sp.]
MTTTTTSTLPGPIDPVGADLTRTLKALKLGQMTQTLPERLALARQRKMSHATFLQLVLADEITRRESRSAMLRARSAGLDPAMRLDAWDELDDLTYDRELLADLATLRFTEAGNGVLILGPVGVGKTHCATALGHIAIRRRLSVHAARADKLFTRLRAARLDHTLDAEIRKLARWGAGLFSESVTLVLRLLAGGFGTRPTFPAGSGIPVRSGSFGDYSRFRCTPQ